MAISKKAGLSVRTAIGGAAFGFAAILSLGMPTSEVAAAECLLDTNGDGDADGKR